MRAPLLVLLLAVGGGCRAAPAPGEPEPPRPRTHVTQIRRSRLSDEIDTTLTGVGGKLEHLGITATFDLYAIYQGNVTGGVRTAHATEGEYQLSFDFDLHRLVGLEGGLVFLRAGGGWDGGINEDVGGVLPVNGLFTGNDPIYVSRLWYQQRLFRDRFAVRVGKQDLTDGFDFHGQTVGFDGNAYANAPETQFLNGSLVNNAAIAFPGQGLAVAALAEPVERVYVAATLANANANPTTAGFSDAFGDGAEWIVMVEAGVVASLGASRLPGVFSVGYWDSEASGYGLYFVMNQLVCREGAEGHQGLGVFARWGYAEDLSPIRQFASVGAQYRGLLPGRDDDVLGLAWGHAFLSEEPASYEGVLEAYYRTKVTPWFFLSPMVQFLVNPTLAEGSNAVVLALRAQILF